MSSSLIRRAHRAAWLLLLALGIINFIFTAISGVSTKATEASFSFGVVDFVRFIDFAFLWHRYVETLWGPPGTNFYDSSERNWFFLLSGAVCLISARRYFVLSKKLHLSSQSSAKSENTKSVSEANFGDTKRWLEQSASRSVSVNKVPNPYRQKPTSSAVKPSAPTPPTKSNAGTPKVKPDTSPVKKSLVSRTETIREIEQQLNVKVTQLIDGSCTFHMMAPGRTLVYRISDSTDRDILSAIEPLFADGKPLAARSTWASRKRTDKRWEPVIVVGYGDPTKTKPNTVVALISVADYFRNSTSFTAVASQVTVMDMVKSDLYVMPPLLLWDGNYASSGNLIGQHFRGAIVPSGPLRPIHIQAEGHEKTEHTLVTTGMAEASVGTLRLSKFDPNFFLQESVGGEMG